MTRARLDTLLQRLRRWLHGPSFREALSEALSDGEAVRLRVSTLERSLEPVHPRAGSEGPAARRIRSFHRG